MYISFVTESKTVSKHVAHHHMSLKLSMTISVTRKWMPVFQMCWYWFFSAWNKKEYTDLFGHVCTFRSQSLRTSFSFNTVLISSD